MPVSGAPPSCTLASVDPASVVVPLSIIVVPLSAPGAPESCFVEEEEPPQPTPVIASASEVEIVDAVRKRRTWCCIPRRVATSAPVPSTVRPWLDAVLPDEINPAARRPCID